MTPEEMKTIEELHKSLDDITYMFCRFCGDDYHCVKGALKALEESDKMFDLDISMYLVEKIERSKK